MPGTPEEPRGLRQAACRKLPEGPLPLGSVKRAQFCRAHDSTYLAQSHLRGGQILHDEGGRGLGMNSPQPFLTEFDRCDFFDS